MNWVILTVGLLALGVFLFILLTDGRFFGKRLTFWIYDRIGPRMFMAADDAERWLALAQEIPIRGDERILDVGTAVGDLPLTLAAMPGFTGHVTGVDWSPRMIVAATAVAQKRGLADKSQFQVVDIREGLPFYDKLFDIIICLGLLETWPHPETIIAEIKRILADDGIFVFSVYKGLSSTNVAISEGWYLDQLSGLEMKNFRIAPCRHNHDVIIAW